MTTKANPNTYGWADVLIRALGVDKFRPYLGLIHVYDRYAYATDSYRAARVVSTMPDGAYDLAGQPAETETPMGRSLADLYAKAFSDTQTITLASEGNRWRHETPRAEARELAAWAYYDGTRRKPTAFVDLDIVDGKLTLTFGLEVRLDPKRNLVHILRDTLPAAQTPVVGYDAGHEAHHLGRFKAEYLHDAWPNSYQPPTLYWQADLKPLAIIHPDGAETVVMPIRTND